MLVNNLVHEHILSQMSRIKVIPLIQGSQEWLDFRKFKIGSSSAASIMGVGFKTPLQLFEDIMEDKPTPVNDAMRRGSAMEPIARAWLNERCKADLQPVVVQHPNPEHDWHISSIDGLCVMPNGLILDGKEILKPGEIFVCEIKCPGLKDHNTALEGKIPDKYLPQCYHILEDLPGVNKILYFSYMPGYEAMVWVDLNDDAMDKQFAKEKDFYSKLLSCKPPEPTEKDWVEFVQSNLIEQANEYSQIMDELSILEERAKEIKENLIQGTSFACRAKIGDLKIQKVIRQGSVDYSQIEALKGINLDQYRKPPIITWRAY